MARITVKNKMYYWNKEKRNHVWTVKYNPANGLFFVKNEKTGNQWELLASEFTLYQRHYNEITASFPDYIHNAVWSIQEFHFHARRGY